MKRRTLTPDPANLCTHCPHEVIRLGSGTLWCPCEDCHAGGLIQGREHKLAERIERVASSPVASVASVAPTTSETNDSDVWVDPLHQL